MAVPKIIEIPMGDPYNLQWHYKKVEISSAEILDCNSNPLEIIAAPGAGKVIIVTELLTFFDWGSVQYATNTHARLRHEGGSTVDKWPEPGMGEGFLEYINDVYPRGTPDANWGADENTAIIFTENTGDPTAGDSTITLYIWYIILEL